MKSQNNTWRMPPTNDVLSGEDGADLIDGGAGNDLIFGQIGQAQLLGEQGDDTIDGGDGTDIAEFSGSFADCRITKLNATTYRIVDSKAGRDGADILTNIEKLNFADVSAVDITLDNPLPVKDVLTIADRSGMRLIKVADLLKNDRDGQSDVPHITSSSAIKGGSIVGSYNATTQEWTPRLTVNGELQFTPDPVFSGVMSFKYKFADADRYPWRYGLHRRDRHRCRNPRASVYQDAGDAGRQFTGQWYLNDINVLPVWKDAYPDSPSDCYFTNDEIWRQAA